MDFLINSTNAKAFPHKHKNYEIIVYTKGNGVLHTDKNDIEVVSGKIAVIPPETIHSSTFDSEFERIYINGPLNQFFTFKSPVIIPDNSSREGLILAKTIYNNRYSNPEYISALINAFAHFLLQNIKFDDEIYLAIKNIVEEITNNFYDANLSPCSLLKKSGYAEDYIRAHYKKATGKTPTQFLNETRINHACHLIHIYGSSLLLSEISESCGFSDYVYFSRKFKQLKGVSPRFYMDNY